MFSYNLRFPGQYSDKETGLFYNNYRDYDPRTGRYVESDPIGLNGGLNTYGYAEGNPLSYVDPTGLFGGATLGFFQRGVTTQDATAIGSMGNMAMGVGVTSATVGTAALAGAIVGVDEVLGGLTISSRDLSLGTLSLIRALSQHPGEGMAPKLPSLPAHSPSAVVRTLQNIRNQSKIPAPVSADPPNFCPKP